MKRFRNILFLLPAFLCLSATASTVQTDTCRTASKKCCKAVDSSCKADKGCAKAANGCKGCKKMGAAAAKSCCKGCKKSAGSTQRSCCKARRMAAPVTVFDNRNSDIPYRIPALAETRDGRLLAVCDYRHNKNDVGMQGGNGLWRVDQVMRSSSDFGRTWSPIQTIVAGEEDASESWRVAFGDPCIVADRESDEVLMMCATGKISYWASRDTCREEIALFRSHDGGRTWDRGTRYTDVIWDLYHNRLSDGGSAGGLFLTSGGILQSKVIKKGKYYRIYIAHPVRHDSGKRWGTFVIYSDDFGTTWQVLGGTKVIPSIAQDESKVDELPDGSLLLSCRNMYGGRRFNVFTYTDQASAAGSWGTEVMPEPMKRGIVNACNGGLAVVPARHTLYGRDVYVVLVSVPQSPQRERLGFFYKEIADAADYNTPEALGAGWKIGKVVTPLGSCYSTLLQMSNNRIALLYEQQPHNNGYDIIFRTYSLKEITNGAYTERK